MRLATYLSLATLVAPVALAVPFGRSSFLARRDNEVRDLYQPIPVKRQESVEPTPSSSEATPTAEPTEEPTSTEENEASTTGEVKSSTELEEYYYSTISDDGYDRETRTVSDYEEGRNTDRRERNRSSSRGNDGAETVIVVIAEVETVTRVVVVERAVLVAVEVNVEFRRNDFGKRFRNRLRRKFRNWDDDNIDQLLIILIQQYEILSRYGNGRFRDTDNDRYERFAERFLRQFDSFENYDNDDISALIVVLQDFDARDLLNFFGKSDSLYRRYRERGNNNDFRGFVDAIDEILEFLDEDDFDVDDIFDLAELLVEDLNVDQLNLFIGNDGRRRDRNRD